MARQKLKGTRLGTVRIYTFGLLIMIAAFLFGYDTGIVGGVLTLKSFSKSFNFDPTNATTKSLAVGLQQLGGFVATLFTPTLTDRFGRKWVVCGSCVIFCIGVIIQVVPSHKIGAFYAGRIISGLGIGSSFVVVPVFSVEQSPKEIRGQLGAAYQLMYTWGILISYWVAYGVSNGMPSVEAQWQVPIGLQMVPAGILGIGVCFMPESVRWLMKKGREQDAWDSLRWIRADDGDEVKMEFGEIRMGILEELRATEGFRYKELLEPANRRRLLTACVMFMNVQLTGATALAYYGPQFFASITGSGGNKSLLITALFGVMKVIAATTFFLFLAERFDRKKIFIAGALGMSVCMLITAVLNKVYPPASKGDAKVTPSGIAGVAMIFLDIAIYNVSWGPLPHPYVSELFPTRIRAIGFAAGSGTQWLFNYLFSTVTPFMIKSLGWGTFLFYTCTDIWSAAFSYFFLKETRSRSLEEMETIFNSRAAFDVDQARRDALDGKSPGNNNEESHHLEEA